MSREPARAVLTHVPEDRDRHVGGDRCEVGDVGEDDLRALAAELEEDALEVALGRVMEESPPDLGGARERDAIDVRVAADRLADGAARAGDDVEDPVGEPGLACRARRCAAGLGDVVEAGLMTIVLPVARAGPSFHAAIWAG